MSFTAKAAKWTERVFAVFGFGCAAIIGHSLFYPKTSGSTVIIDISSGPSAKAKHIKGCESSSPQIVTWGDSNARGTGNSLVGRFQVVNYGKDSAGILATTQVRPSSVFTGAACKNNIGIVYVGTNDIEPLTRISKGKVDSPAITKYAQRVVHIAEEASRRGMSTAIVGVSQLNGDYYIIKGDFRTRTWNPMALAVDQALKSAVTKSANPNITFVMPQGKPLDNGVHRGMNGYRDTVKLALNQLERNDLSLQIS